MTVLKKVKFHPNVVDCLKELPFYNKHIKKQILNAFFLWSTKCNKKNYAFEGYATSYKVEVTEKKDPIKQLEARKSSIKNLFMDLLNKTKGLKYQITPKVMLKNTSQMKKLNLDQFILIQ